LRNGDLIWVEKNEEGFIKKLGKDCLISLNPKYKPIEISDSDSCYTFGRVIGKTAQR